MKLIINGIEIPPEQYSGANATSIDIVDSDEQGERVSTVSSEYTLSGAAYEQVAATFINDPLGKLNYLEVKIYESGCCENDVLLFEGILKGENVDWCYNECTAKVVFTEYDDDAKKADCIHSTLIDDNWNGFQQAVHPSVPYCVELRPDLLQHIVLIFGIILNIVLTVLYPIVAALSLLNSILQTIEDAINFFGANISISLDFDGNSGTSLLQEYQNWISNMNERIVGCSRTHSAPFVRSYIQNVCDKCGLQFSSSILNQQSGILYNTMYLYAPVDKGSLNNTSYNPNNRQIKTLVQLLDDLKIPFNAKWEIKDGTLYFERRDYFDNGQVWASYMALDAAGMVDETVCFRWRTEDSPAFIEFVHQIDALDTTSVEAKKKYNDIVDWNIPFNPLQVGSKQVLIPFAPTRFRMDGNDEDVLDIYSNSPGIGTAIQQSNDYIILSSHLANTPRLLIKDQNSPINEAKIIRQYAAGSFVSNNITYAQPYFIYNWPLWFQTPQQIPQQTEIDEIYGVNDVGINMYGRFYSIDNPKLLTDLGKEFTFSFRYNCELISTVTNARYIVLPIGDEENGTVGRIKQLTVNLQDKTITVNGHI